MWQIKRVLIIPWCGGMCVPGFRIEIKAIGDRRLIFGIGRTSRSRIVSGSFTKIPMKVTRLS